MFFLTEFERQIYVDMKSADRVLLYMIKAHELIEYTQIMTHEDMKLLERVCKEADGAP